MKVILFPRHRAGRRAGIVASLFCFLLLGIPAGTAAGEQTGEPLAHRFRSSRLGGIWSEEHMNERLDEHPEYRELNQLTSREFLDRMETRPGG